MATKSLSPSQIAKLQEMLGSSLRKSNPFSDEAQDFIENSWDELKQAIESACVAVIRQMLDHKRNTIIVEVDVNYDRSQQQMLDALSRWQHIDASIVPEIPCQHRGQERVVFEFFRLNRYASDKEVEQERTERGLVRDVYAQAAVNEANPVFAHSHPNGVSWKDSKDHLCCLACCHWYEENRGESEDCSVILSHDTRVWGDFWWFGGRRRFLHA